MLFLYILLKNLNIVHFLSLFFDLPRRKMSLLRSRFALRFNRSRMVLRRRQEDVGSFCDFSFIDKALHVRVTLVTRTCSASYTNVFHALHERVTLSLIRRSGFYEE